MNEEEMPTAKYARRLNLAHVEIIKYFVRQEALYISLTRPSVTIYFVRFHISIIVHKCILDVHTKIRIAYK